MNVRELMARLNCSTIRFEIGSGGIPELTNQDIAAAVGMVKDIVARETFCAIWWPEGADKDIHKKLLDRVLAEYCRLAKEASAAKLEAHIAESELSTKRHLSGEEKSYLARLQAKAKEAHDRTWPGNMKMYPKIIDAVINEIRNPKLCTACKGRGTVTAGTLLKQCEKCNGTGSQRETNLWRAMALGVVESTYRKSWVSVYEWTHGTVSQLESKAASSLRALHQFEISV